jgi:hypothetical protein
MQINNLIVLLLTVLLLQARAQSVSPFVIASSGGYFSNATFSLSSTFGEMTMVETFSDGNNFLTQGFQQPFNLTTGISNPIPDNCSFNIYPNPSDGNFMLTYHYASAGTASFRVFNMLGQEVNMITAKFDKGVNFQNFNLPSLSNGIYFLEANYSFNDGKVLKNVSKINSAN